MGWGREGGEGELWLWRGDKCEKVVGGTEKGKEGLCVGVVRTVTRR